MTLLGLFKKRKIPDELPDLATEDIESRFDKNLEKDKDVIEKHLKEDKKERRVRHIEINDKDEKESGPITDIPKKSFFDELEKHINEEIDDLDKLEDWYENKFMPQDIVSNMRNYWENQKTKSVLQVLGRNFKQRINEKTQELQSKEKEWQNIYFDLIEKEEEIKEEEEELKRILSEFVELCRRKKTKINLKNNEQKKEKKKIKKKSS